MLKPTMGGDRNLKLENGARVKAQGGNQFSIWAKWVKLPWN